MKKSTSKKRGFTLVELLVVIAILSILATVTVVSYTSFINRANDSVAQQELTQIRDYYIAGQYLVPPTELSNELLKELGLEGMIEEGTVNGKECYKYTLNDGTAYWLVENNEVTVGLDSWIPKEFPWKDSNVVFVGDSITYGVGTTKSYHQYLNDLNEFSSITHMGIAGSCISAESDYGISNTPLINRWHTIPNADLIVIFMGTNDYGHETPLGSINDTSDTSFYGALDVVVNGIRNAYPNSQLVFVTPLHRYGFGTSKILGTQFASDDKPNGVGATLGDYVDAIKAVCGKYSLPVIDLFTECTLDPKDKNYYPDGLHPNAAGHDIIADLIYECLAKIPNNYAGDDDDSGDSSNTETLSVSLKYGNVFAAGFNGKNRASSEINLYLTKGTTVSIKDNANYDWALALTDNEISTNNKGYFPDAGWTKQENCEILEDGWYGFVIKKTDDSEFVFEGETESKDLYDYFNISVPLT